jgi:glycolate oxidase
MTRTRSTRPAASTLVARPWATARNDSALIRVLEEALPTARLIVDADVLATYRQDQARFVEAGQPIAAIVARSLADVRATLEVATLHRTPVVPRGAGSGLSGGANAIDGCIVLSLERMDRILEIDTADYYAVVEPGVLNGDLSAAVAELGFFYPPDPASAMFSTIGGNIATNAGGLCCLKYGVTRDAVLGLEVVLADGTVMHTGRRTVKGVAGYDLTGLLVGSEGTLGVVTRATLRLRPAPDPPGTLVAFFSSLTAAGEAVANAAGIAPSLLELMDRSTLVAVDDYTGMGLDRDAAALVLAQTDIPEGQAEREMAALAAHCDAAGATYVAYTTDPHEAEQVLTARKLAYPALERRGATLLDDVAVPRSRIPALLAKIEAIAERNEVEIGTFGHVGDGNMHPTIIYDPADEASVKSARGAFADILAVALELGGTLTGEHGVGVLKRPFLAAELGPGATRVHWSIKAALDPEGILNPGKAIP